MKMIIKEVIGDNEYKKYVFTTKEGDTLLVTATGRLQAINILGKDFTSDLFEKMDFTISKVHYEIKEDGSLISYIKKEEEEDE
jgi:hypothetical protein